MLYFQWIQKITLLRPDKYLLYPTLITFLSLFLFICVRGGNIQNFFDFALHAEMCHNNRHGDRNVPITFTNLSGLKAQKKKSPSTELKPRTGQTSGALKCRNTVVHAHGMQYKNAFIYIHISMNTCFWFRDLLKAYDVAKKKKKIETTGIIGSALNELTKAGLNEPSSPLKLACLVPGSERWCETLYELQTKALIITLQIWVTSGGRRVPE